MVTIDKILSLPHTNPKYRLAPNTVYYIEDHYDRTVNGFIIDNYEEIVNAFASVGLGFVYFPLLFQGFKPLAEWCSPTTSRVWNYILGSDYHGLLPAPGYVIPMRTGHGLSMACRYQNALCSETVSELVERISGRKLRPPRHCCFPSGRLVEVSRILKKITGKADDAPQSTPPCSRSCSRPSILHGVSPHSHPDDRDNLKDTKEIYSILAPPRLGNYCHDHYSEDQLAQVERMLREMEKLGIGRQLLIQILNEGQKKEFSRIRVTSSYHVFLEHQEWGNKEVELPPLHRAIYLLYLKYEEGIAIKDLAGSNEEIFEIYRKISNGLNTDVQRERVIKATDPLDNRINTIFSFIRRTFESLFGSPSVANYYGITGTRGQVRRIELDRKYVTWEKKL